MEGSAFQASTVLCNKTLEALEETGLKARLNGILRKNETHPIQFIGYDALTLIHDSTSKKKRICDIPDILITLKDVAKDHAQSKSNDPNDFDPSLPPDCIASSQIDFKEILGCMVIERIGPSERETAGGSYLSSPSSQSHFPELQDGMCAPKPITYKNKPDTSARIF